MANKEEVVMQYLTKIWLRFFLLGCVVVLSGCSSSEMAPYSKTFDHILTDQYIWSYGSGGIYWVSNEKIVLEAQIKNDLGVLNHGLFEVDVRGGSYIKLVDVPKSGPYPYKYCFDGKTLHVMTAGGAFKKVNSPKEYQVKISELAKKNKRNRYSSLRCGFVDTLKEEKARYIPLRFEDGFIRNQAGESKTDSVRVFLSDGLGNNLKELDEPRLDSRGVIGVRRFVPHMNAYSGNTSFNRNCTYLTWLYREDWRLEQKELCIHDWSSGSKLIQNLKGALYVEHHTDLKKQPKTYVISQEKELPIEMEQVRGSAVSPDGCKVAYGVGAYKSGKSGVRQKLKVFNYCEYQQKGQK